MDRQNRSRKNQYAGVVLCSSLLLFACGDDGAGPEDEATGASLQGTVVAFDAPGGVAGPALSAAVTPGVEVSIGTKETVTDEDGFFQLFDIAIGDQVLKLRKDATEAEFLVSGITRGTSFAFDQIQYSAGQVSTAHTGTWMGTGGSTDPGSQGQIALTMILQANGNVLTGTANIGAPDSTVWSITGIETGTTVDGSMSVVSTKSSCASGGDFSGTFSADTLSGTFIEVNPPAGCGTPESGTFSVVKQ